MPLSAEVSEPPRYYLPFKAFAGQIEKHGNTGIELERCPSGLGWLDSGGALHDDVPQLLSLVSLLVAAVFREPAVK